MVYPICHLLVLGSACFNPLLYGWLNDNFRREFVKALCCCSKAQASVRGASAGGARTNGPRSMMAAANVAGGSARPSRRRGRRASELTDDIELEPCRRYAERAGVSANDPEQLESLVNK